MRSYNPENTSKIPPQDLVKSFFEEDVFAADAFLHFKKELFDYFASNPDAKKAFRTHWILNVHATWTFLNQLDSDDFLNYGIEQIPEAVRQGFDVAEKLVWYMAINFRNPKLMTLFYSQLRSKFYGSEALVGLTGEELKISDLVQQVRLLNSYAGDTIRAAELYDKLQHTIFSGSEKDASNDYVMVDNKEAVINLVNLTNFFLQVEPEVIWESVNTYTFSQETGMPAEQVVAPVIQPILDPEDAPELTDKEKEKLASEMQVEKNSKEEPKTEKTMDPAKSNTKQIPVEETASDIKPTYAEIRAKVDSVFPKDKSGVYKDLDGVLMALEKAADKYNDPKIAELYYFDEASGAFTWNV